MNHTIIIYRFTGKQGIFTIPSNWCKECDLLLNIVYNVIDHHADINNINLIIRPWFIWFLVPLFQYHTLHAPMLIINGKLISAGIVPTKEKILDALK